MTQRMTKAMNRPAVIAALALFALAATTGWDASRMSTQATYGINPSAASYAVAVFLVLLGAGHLASAFMSSNETGETVDWRAIVWIALALSGLIGALAIGAGFILGATLLFACTARAFGRKAFIVDIGIGAALGVVIFVFFNKLLSLALPMGPLESLF
jgi:putative tricarboxylic transport membrane protein